MIITIIIIITGQGISLRVTVAWIGKFGRLNHYNQLVEVIDFYEEYHYKVSDMRCRFVQLNMVIDIIGLALTTFITICVRVQVSRHILDHKNTVCRCWWWWLQWPPQTSHQSRDQRWSSLDRRFNKNSLRMPFQSPACLAKWCDYIVSWTT